jgi:hypothetical protein
MKTFSPIRGADLFAESAAPVDEIWNVINADQKLTTDGSHTGKPL